MIYDTLSNLDLNLKFWLDIVFLKDGHFTNISKNKTIRGIDASKLVPDTNSSSDILGISGVQVWQSPFQNWVYESGITLNQAPIISGLAEPIIASGIYINGTFFTQSSGVSGIPFYLDYINGRIIFSGIGIPSNSIVQSDFSYKHYRIDWVDGEDAQEFLGVYAESSLKDNPLADSIEIYPSGDIRVNTFPCIYIEIPEEQPRPFELGNRSLVEQVDIFLHVYALNRWQRNIALELLKNRINLNSYLIDYNYAPLPLSGLTNTLSPNYIAYQDLLTNPIFNGNKVVSWTYYIKDGNTKRLPSDGPYFKGVCTYNIDVYNIAPNGRIPINQFIQ